MASVSRIFARNWLPSPSPLLAPFTRPAISTISTVAGTTRLGLQRLSSTSSLLSGTIVEPTLGSMVQNGKFALCAFPELTQLKRVDFPTLGSPTMPHLSAIYTFIKNSRRKFTHNFYICRIDLSTSFVIDEVAEANAKEMTGTVILSEA